MSTEQLRSAFRQQCAETLEFLGDRAMQLKEYDKAVLQYSIALDVEAPSPQGILIKRSTARAKMRAWEESLNDAEEVRLFSIQCEQMIMVLRRSSVTPPLLVVSRGNIIHWSARSAGARRTKHSSTCFRKYNFQSTQRPMVRVSYTYECHVCIDCI